MRIYDLGVLAIKSLRKKWIILPVIGIGIATFCLCLAGGILDKIHEEKSEKYELVVSQIDVNFSNSIINKINETYGVVSSTLVSEVPITMVSGEQIKQITLIGINPDYLNLSYSVGGVFPNESVMPYIILNSAAINLFSESLGEVEDLVQFNKNFSIQLGDDTRPIISKVCGILATSEDVTEQPEAYISLSVAKTLQRQSGHTTEKLSAYVRVINIGYADAVSRTLTAQGLFVINSTETLQTGWSNDLKETTYMLLIGGLSLVFSTTLILTIRELSMIEDRFGLIALHWIGLKESKIKQLPIIQAILISVFGIIIGTIVGLSLPVFLTIEQKSSSLFAIAIPFWAIILTSIICLIAVVIPHIKARKAKN